MALKGMGRRVEVSAEDRRELERIVLAASEGQTTEQIAERVGCGERMVKKWRPRYARHGIEGLKDAPRSGAPLTHGPQRRALLIAKACTRPQPTVEGAGGSGGPMSSWEPRWGCRAPRRT